MFVFGQLEDQIGLLVWSEISHHIFKISNPVLANHNIYQNLFIGMLRPWLTNQPLIWLILSLGLSVFGYIFYNVFIALSTAFNYYFSYKLLKDYKYAKLGGLLIAFSSYFWIHLGRHVVEQQFWVFPAFLYLYFKQTTQNNKLIRYSVILALFTTITTLISNYYGFFLLIIFGVLSIAPATIFKLKRWILTTLISATMIGIILYPFIYTNYINKARLSTNDQKLGRQLQRPYTDFFTFSIRPWYLVMPPIKNPILGETSKILLNKIEQTKYFLADDYFEGEHSGNYLGLTLFIATILLSTCAYRTTDTINKKLLLSNWVVFIVSLYIAMPPFFTIGGINIYTPNALIAEYFPMFRTMARISIVLQTILVFNFILSINTLIEQNKINSKFANILVFVIVIATLIESYIPPRIGRYDKAPTYAQYLKIETDEKTKFAVYPYSLADNAVFWLPDHERLLINPRGYKLDEFDSELITESLATTDGIRELQNNEAELLIVGKNVSDEDLSFFVKTPALKLKSTLDDSYVFDVIR